MKFQIKKIKKRYIIIFVIVVLILISVLNSMRKPKVEYNTAQVTKGQLVQTVSETGTVKSNSELNLNFLNSGKLAKLNVKIGDNVKKDQILAELDYQAVKFKEQEAKAAVDVSRANLAKLLNGATPQEIAISERSVDQAKSAYDSALVDQEKTKKTVSENISQAEKRLNDLQNKTDKDVTATEQAVNVAQTTYDNAVKTYQSSVDNAQNTVMITQEDKASICNTALDNVNKILIDKDAEPYLSVKNTIYLNNAKGYYNEGVTYLNTARATIAKAKTDVNYLTTATNDLIKALNKTLESLNNTYKSLEYSLTSSYLTQALVDTYKTTISTQTTYVNTAISVLQSAQQGYDNAKLAYNTNTTAAKANLVQAQANLDDALTTAQNALSSAKVNGDSTLSTAQARVDSTLQAWEVAKAQLNKVRAGATAQDIALVQAQVRQAEAGLNLAQKQIADSQIKAPIDGTITKSNYEIGEDVNATKPVLSLLGENNLVVEVDISEADINKLALNDPVEITLDAFGDDQKFYGFVYFIEPAETVIQDVIYYKVKINFDMNTLTKIKQEGKIIKSGMTANTIITTIKKNEVLVAPNRAILDKDGKKYTRILVNNNMKEVDVTTGVQGDGGQTEILSGLKEGDTVVVSIKNTK